MQIDAMDVTAYNGRKTLLAEAIMSANPYQALAARLDALPNGFPSTPDGAELRILRKLFKPEEALLAASLRLTLETPAEIAERLGADPAVLGPQLKSMAKHGLIKAGRMSRPLEPDARGVLGFGLLPFVVGIYEMQAATMDAELARLFEDYYRQAFVQTTTITPQVHRVIPVGKSIKVEMEVRPYESAAEIVAASKAWGVVDCICRKQKALIGEGCNHPVDVCMVLAPVPGAFDHAPAVRAQTQEEAMATLRRSAEAGLVHSVSNNQEGLWYICNCCTCSCGILRGLVELGRANVVARSAFVNQVDQDRCGQCGTCVDACQFDALVLTTELQIDSVRCVGCGVCVLVCPEDALGLVRRPESEVLPPPVTEGDWQAARAQARLLDMAKVV
jgi:Na+-translocating ferredoxin:NAD+ oxidoreductase subunit B